MTAQYLRLKENHPTLIKLNKLFELADELGISISFHNSGAVVRDNEWENQEIYLRDIEDESNRTYPITTFPPTTEWRAITDNPKYTEEEKKRREDWAFAVAEGRRIEEEKKLAKENELKEREVARMRVEELKLLEKLKAKYET